MYDLKITIGSACRQSFHKKIVLDCFLYWAHIGIYSSRTPPSHVHCVFYSTVTEGQPLFPSLHFHEIEIRNAISKQQVSQF